MNLPNPELSYALFHEGHSCDTGNELNYPEDE